MKYAQKGYVGVRRSIASSQFLHRLLDLLHRIRRDFALRRQTLSENHHLIVLAESIYVDSSNAFACRILSIKQGILSIKKKREVQYIVCCFVRDSRSSIHLGYPFNHGMTTAHSVVAFGCVVKSCLWESEVAEHDSRWTLFNWSYPKEIFDGFNLSRKYWASRQSSSNSGGNKYLKPPPRKIRATPCSWLA